MRWFAGLLLVGAATAAAAQPEAEPLTEVPQISSPRMPVPSAPVANRTGDAPPQLTKRQAGASNTPQLTSEPRTASTPPQLTSGGRNAQPPAPLSSAADGRTGAIERVEGDDRCDPQAPAKSKSDCSRVMENRAAEFRRRTAPSLSPEQRILIGDEAREASGVEGAARRLAINGEDAESMDAQSVAAIVLRKPPEPAKDKEEPAKDQTEAAAALVNALLNPQ